MNNPDEMKPTLSQQDERHLLLLLQTIQCYKEQKMGLYRFASRLDEISSALSDAITAKSQLRELAFHVEVANAVILEAQERGQDISHRKDLIDGVEQSYSQMESILKSILEPASQTEN